MRPGRSAPDEDRNDEAGKRSGDPFSESSTAESPVHYDDTGSLMLVSSRTMHATENYLMPLNNFHIARLIELASAVSTIRRIGADGHRHYL